MKVLEDRVVATSQGQADVAGKLHDTADGLPLHKADDGGATAASLHTIADALELLSRESSTLGDAFRMLIAEALGDDASFFAFLTWLRQIVASAHAGRMASRRFLSAIA